MKEINNKKIIFILKKNNFYCFLISFILIIFIFFFNVSIIFLQRNEYKNIIGNLNKINESVSNSIQKEKKNIASYLNISNQKCYLSLDNSNIKIIHLIMTRFLIEFLSKSFSKNLYKKDYILNGIRVMKKYLFPSLYNQSCKNFIWILILGNKANLTYIKSLLNLNNSFESIVIYQKDIKRYVRKISKGFDVLITTRIDYDDRIYYDAVNDVRKAININRPMILYGYNRGVYYFELEDKYYDYYSNWENKGVLGIFISLITVLNKTNDTYTVYDLGSHVIIKKTLLEKYKSYGIKNLDYDFAIFDNGDPKFVYVKHNYSSTFQSTKINRNKLKLNNFNLSKFYGK